MSIWSWAWVSLLGACALVELAALVNKERGDTLSEHIWKWFAVRDNRRFGWVGFRRTLLLLAMAWLTAHFVTGGRF